MKTSQADTDAVHRFRERLSDTACLDASTLARALYSTDASLYRVVPEVVATPRSTDELIELVRVALAVGLPITGRGAGTSCAGNAVGPGLVIDMSRHLNKVLSVDIDAGTAVVEPGVIQALLQQVATKHGWRYGPDPSTSNRCTIGGMIGNNACGPRALGYGRSADNLIELEVITGTGDLVTLRPGAEGGVLDQLRELVMANLATIRTEFGKFSRQVSGYSMEHLLPEHGFNLASFFAGTEGTLGIITRATVKLVRDAPLKTTVALGYPTMADGADAMPAILPFRPTACEGMDRRLADVVAERIGPDAVPDLPSGDAWLFIELVGDDADEIAGRAERLVEAAGAIEGWVVSDVTEAGRLWTIRSDAAGLAAVALDKPAHAGWEDSAVRPTSSARTCATSTRCSTGSGCTVCRTGTSARVACIAGSTSRSTSRTAPRSCTTTCWPPVSWWPATAAQCRGATATVGPQRAAAPDVQPRCSRPVRAGQAPVRPSEPVEPGRAGRSEPLANNVRIAETRRSPLAIKYPEFNLAVHQCTGVGKCRADTTRAGTVMCPSFQATRDEKDSTRGRARVLQEMINGTLVDGGWRSPEVAEALDLCLACKGCRHDCPTGVDMAAYKSQVLYHKHRGRLRPLSHYALGWLPRWGRLATKLRLGVLANFALQTPGLKHLVRAVAGVDQRRPMPRFRTGAAASHQHYELGEVAPTRGPVAVWVDSFTDAFAGSQLVALLKLLVTVGFDPKVISQDACCGLTWITTGQLDGARRQLRHALDVLSPIAEQGIPIVGMEPSCLAVWRSDAAELLPDDARVERSRRASRRWPNCWGHWTVGARRAWPGTRSRPAALPPVVGARLAGRRRTAGAHRRHSGESRRLLWAGRQLRCRTGHYDVSVKVAEHDLLPAIRAAGPDAIILADGFSCRKQVADLEGSQAMTLAELLASHS